MCMWPTVAATVPYAHVTGPVRHDVWRIGPRRERYLWGASASAAALSTPAVAVLVRRVARCLGADWRAGSH